MTVLSPLRTTAGLHQISLRLAPEGLGVVNATVVVNSGHVLVQLSADNPAAHQALSAALPDLRNQLGAGGQQATVMMSSQGGGGFANPQGSWDRSGRLSNSGQGDPEIVPLTLSAPAVAGTSKSIDVRL